MYLSVFSNGRWTFSNSPGAWNSLTSVSEYNQPSNPADVTDWTVWNNLSRSFSPSGISINRPTSTGCVYMEGNRSCRVMYTTGSESSGGGRDENLPVGLPCEKNTDCHRFYSMTCSNNYCSAPFMNSTNFVEFPNSRFFTSNDPRLPSDP